jgi:hypothetical protein
VRATEIDIPDGCSDTDVVSSVLAGHVDVIRVFLCFPSIESSVYKKVCQLCCMGAKLGLSL